VVYLRVIVEPRQRRGPGPVGTDAPKKVAKYIIEEAEKSVHCGHNNKANRRSLEYK
jgi:hypothetical protein